MRRILVVLAALLLTLPALAAPLKIVALGDSATAGWLVARKEAYPAQLAGRSAPRVTTSR